MRGRKPIPTQVKQLRGTDRPDRHNDGEPQFRVPKRMLRPPAHLDDGGRAIWGELGKMLLDAGLFTVGDRYLLEEICIGISRGRRAEVMVRETGGEIITGPNGGQVYNPWLSVSNKAWEQVRKLLGEFGLTPAERSRLKVAVQENEESIADILIREANLADER